MVSEPVREKFDGRVRSGAAGEHGEGLFGANAEPTA